MSTRVLSVAEAAKEATAQLLESSKEYIVIGEGVPDPKACFGTTKGLLEEFPDQVFDMPISENGGVGFCIGASLNGLKPIMIHMRQDFLMYAMDQIVNNAAKWHSMFGGQKSVPIVIKAFTGRGWGAGHQHSQNFESIFAHIPGLKVVVPSSPKNAKGLLIAAARDPNPVIILEHRWIHNILGSVQEEIYETPIGLAEVIQEGHDITIVSWGHSLLEARKACAFLSTYNISAELIDLLSLRPLDMETISKSVMKTKRILIVNDSWGFGGISSEIIANLPCPFEHVSVLNYPFYPSSSPYITKDYYPNSLGIIKAVLSFLNIYIDLFGEEMKHKEAKHDVPDSSFIGPF